MIKTAFAQVLLERDQDTTAWTELTERMLVDLWLRSVLLKH
jgi:hypothetical protein